MTFEHFSEVLQKRELVNVYELSSAEFKEKVTRNIFLSQGINNDVKDGYKTVAELEHFELIYDSRASGFLCIAIIRENLSPPGKPRFVSMTWAYDIKKQRWLYLNLPFVEFLALPLSVRLRW